MTRKLHKVVTYSVQRTPAVFEEELDSLSAEGYEFVGTVYRSDGEPAVLLTMDDPAVADERRSEQRAHNALNANR